MTQSLLKLQRLVKVRKFVIDNIDRTEEAMRTSSMDAHIRTKRLAFLATLRQHVEANRFVSISEMDYFIDLVELICVVCGVKAVHRIGFDGYCREHAPDARRRRDEVASLLNRKTQHISDAYTARERTLRRQDKSRNVGRRVTGQRY